MESDTNNLQAARWTADPAQQEKFFAAVGPRINAESRSIARKYGLGMYHEDIRSDIEIKLLQQMSKINTDGPFAKDSPEEAATSLLENGNFLIHNLARSLAGEEADRRRKQSRQAEILAHVGPPDLRPDAEKVLFALAESLPRVVSKTPDLTSREIEILRLEGLRCNNVDDLPTPIFDQVAQAAGTSGPELRAHIEDHDERGHLSPRDRKTLSRARAKVKKVLTAAAAMSLLTIVFALSVALLDAIHQGRSIRQNDSVKQASLIDEIALTHQDKLSNEIALDHQGYLTDEIALTHQGYLTDEVALDHQGYLVDEIALDHQGDLI
jgi:hypothetical protein